MDKNEIKRANRKALPKFMLIMVICFIIGGTIGFCSAKYGLNTLAGGLRSYLSKRNKTTCILGRRK